MISLSVVLTCCLIGVFTPAADNDIGSATCDCESVLHPSFAIYALSTGRGVPDSTYEAYAKASKYLQKLQNDGRVLQLTETRIGIEGERRLCVVFDSSEHASEVCEQICSEVRDIPLINIEKEVCTQ